MAHHLELNLSFYGTGVSARVGVDAPNWLPFDVTRSWPLGLDSVADLKFTSYQLTDAGGIDLDVNYRIYVTRILLPTDPL